MFHEHGHLRHFLPISALQGWKLAKALLATLIWRCRQACAGTKVSTHSVQRTDQVGAWQAYGWLTLKSHAKVQLAAKYGKVRAIQCRPELWPSRGGGRKQLKREQWTAKGEIFLGYYPKHKRLRTVLLLIPDDCKPVLDYSKVQDWHFAESYGTFLQPYTHITSIDILPPS